MKFRLESPTGHGSQCRFVVEGQDISAGVRALTLRAHAEGMVTAVIEPALMVGEFDGEARVVVSANAHATLVALGWTPPGALPPFDGAEREHTGHGTVGVGVELPADGVEREVELTGAPA
jgi:hypothetical protein